MYIRRGWGREVGHFTRNSYFELRYQLTNAMRGRPEHTQYIKREGTSSRSTETHHGHPNNVILCFAPHHLFLRSLPLRYRQRADTEVPLQQGHGWEWKLQALLELQQTKRECHFCRPCEHNRMGRLRTVSQRTNAQQRRHHRMGGQQRTSLHASTRARLIWHWQPKKILIFLSLIFIMFVHSVVGPSHCISNYSDHWFTARLVFDQRRGTGWIHHTGVHSELHHLWQRRLGNKGEVVSCALVSHSMLSILSSRAHVISNHTGVIVMNSNSLGWNTARHMELPQQWPAPE